MSTFKFTFPFFNNGSYLSDNDEKLLRQTLKGRRNICPDQPRIAGAIDRAKLDQLHGVYKHMKEQGQLSEVDYTELYEASTVMYACALRIFQLRGLRKDCFNFKSDTAGWITVRAKVTKQNTKTKETKQIHPQQSEGNYRTSKQQQ